MYTYVLMTCVRKSFRLQAPLFHVGKKVVPEVDIESGVFQSNGHQARDDLAKHLCDEYENSSLYNQYDQPLAISIGIIVANNCLEIPDSKKKLTLFIGNTRREWTVEPPNKSLLGNTPPGSLARYIMLIVLTLNHPKFHYARLEVSLLEI